MDTSGLFHAFKGKLFPSRSGGGEDECGEHYFSALLVLWWGTKCVFSLFLKVVIQDYGCWLGSLKIESTEVLKFVLFYFYFLNCLVTFQDDKWSKNAFVLPL